MSRRYENADCIACYQSDCECECATCVKARANRENAAEHPEREIERRCCDHSEAEVETLRASARSVSALLEKRGRFGSEWANELQASIRALMASAENPRSDFGPAACRKAINDLIESAVRTLVQGSADLKEKP